jgi:hypothetical protein
VNFHGVASKISKKTRKKARIARARGTGQQPGSSGGQRWWTAQNCIMLRRTNFALNLRCSLRGLALVVQQRQRRTPFFCVDAPFFQSFPAGPEAPSIISKRK